MPIRDVADSVFGMDDQSPIGSVDAAPVRPIGASLRSAQDLNTLILNSSRDCIVVLDLEGHTQFVSPGGIESMEVVDVNAIIGLSWLRVWKDGEHEAALHAVEEARAGGVGRFQGFCPTHKGTPKWWDVVISSLPGPDGKPDRLVSVGRDITELRRTEQRLASIEDRLTVALGASSMVGIWDWDLKTDRVYADANFARMFAVDPALAADGVAPGTFIEGIHPEDRDRIGAAIKRAMASTDEYEEEFRAIDAEGHERWVCARGRRRNDALGRPLHFPGVVTDITATRSAEQALRESEMRFRELADNINQLAWTADGSGWIYWYNQRWYDYTGTTLEEMQGWGWQKVHHPDHVDRVVEKVAEAFRTGAVWEDTFPLRGRDGEYRWFLSRARPIRNEAGEVVRWFGTNTDTTAQRNAEEKLRDLNQTLERRVADALAERDRSWQISQDLLAVADSNGLLRAVNPAWSAVLDLPPDQIIGRSHLDLIHPDDRTASESAHAHATREPLLRYENRLRHRDGTYRWISWTATPEGDLVYVSGRHITTEKEAAEALEATREQLRQSQKMEAVGQLTGGLAHDFNNLLIGITGSLEMLQRRVAQGRIGEVDRYVNAAQGAARRAASLTHRLLAFSRRQTLDPRPTDINRLIREMEELLRRTVGPSIEVEVVGAVGLWTTLVDTNQLENALLNLCINARDAMPDGGRLTIETANKWLDERAARDRDLPPGQFLSLCVTDTGTGMTREVVERAIDPFFTTKPIGMGTGLGLSMVYGFARQSGGQMRIYSEVGHGTTMCLYLPRNHGVESRPEAAESYALERAQHGQTVLVVDDEQTVRMLVVEVIEELGYGTLEAADGASGLTVLRSDARIDLLITDVGLPGGMNGRQVADGGRTVRPALKVLFITGYAENAVVGNGHLEPGMQVLTKPFTMDALAGRVKDLIGNG